MNGRKGSEIINLHIANALLSCVKVLTVKVFPYR